MSIEEFIEARITEREKAAKAAKPDWSVAVERNPEIYGTLGEDIANHVMWHDPAEALQLWAALRRVVDAEIVNLEFRDYELGDGCTHTDIRAGRCRERGDIERSAVLRALAAIWSDHPDYQQDWAI